jgi:hypothetical protein
MTQALAGPLDSVPTHLDKFSILSYDLDLRIPRLSLAHQHLGALANAVADIRWRRGVPCKRARDRVCSLATTW